MTTDPTALVDSEGEEMSLNKVDKALQSVGITLQNANCQFRDFDDVILELADDLCYGCRMSEFGGHHDQEWTTKYIHSKRYLDKSKNIETDLEKIELIGFYHEDEDYGCFSNWFLSDFEYAGKPCGCRPPGK